MNTISTQVEETQPTCTEQTLTGQGECIEQRIVEFAEYCAGQLLYLRRQPIDACENNHQRRGWWAALAQDSACETSGYLKRTNQVIDLDSLPF